MHKIHVPYVRKNLSLKMYIVCTFNLILNNVFFSFNLNEKSRTMFSWISRIRKLHTHGYKFLVLDNADQLLYIKF
jgi:hypothetical protein